MEKKFLIATVRAESKEIVCLEIVDESSQAPAIKTAFLRISTEDYAKLGYPTPAKNKINLKIDVESLV